MKSTCYIITGFYQQIFKAFVEIQTSVQPIYIYFLYQLLATSFYQEYLQLGCKIMVVVEVWMKIFNVSRLSAPPPTPYCWHTICFFPPGASAEVHPVIAPGLQHLFSLKQFSMLTY